MKKAVVNPLAREWRTAGWKKLRQDEILYRAVAPDLQEQDTAFHVHAFGCMPPRRPGALRRRQAGRNAFWGNMAGKTKKIEKMIG